MRLDAFRAGIIADGKGNFFAGDGAETSPTPITNAPNAAFSKPFFNFTLIMYAAGLFLTVFMMVEFESAQVMLGHELCAWHCELKHTYILLCFYALLCTLVMGYWTIDGIMNESPSDCATPARSAVPCTRSDIGISSHCRVHWFIVNLVRLQ